jgi:glycosyltransferase involved in cell wall biosynthesis
MRVAHLIDSGGVYGAEVVVLDLAERLNRLTHRQVLVSIGDSSDLEKPVEREAKARGIAVCPVRLKGWSLLGGRTLLEEVRRQAVDIVHVHGYKPTILFATLPRVVRGLPVVATIHGSTYTGGWNRMAVYRWMETLALRNVDAVVAVHERLVPGSVGSVAKRQVVAVIENGVAVGASLPETERLDPEVLAFCDKHPVVGTLGRLSTEKGHDILLRSVRLLVDGGYDLRVVLIGEGRRRGDLLRVAEGLGLQDRVLMPGYIAAARHHLSLFDVFALPSLTEGLPIALLEAMDARTPIVATRVGGVPDVLDRGQAGVLVNPGDAEALAAGIEQLLLDRTLCRRLVEHASNRVAERYSTDAVARRYLELYERLGRTRAPVVRH